MKTLLLLALMLWAVEAFAQTAPAPMQQAQPTAQDLETQLEAVGCKAERQTAAQTIVQLRQQVADMQKKLDAKDPPKSGATKK